jgi:anti-anti-sigma factor
MADYARAAYRLIRFGYEPRAQYVRGSFGSHPGALLMSLDELSFALTRLSDAALTLELTDSGSTAVIVITGELDLSTTHLLTDLVDHVAQEPRPRPVHLCLDLAGVTFFSAEGVRALLHARRVVTSTAGTLVLREPSTSVRRVFDITGEAGLFDLDRGR